MRAEAVVDLDAIEANVARLADVAQGAAVMAVVKADGYGHGMLPSAWAALAGGARWLGVAVVEEALALRAAGVDTPVLAWLLAPGDELAAAVRADVDLGISQPWALEKAAAAGRDLGRAARVHLKVDSGLGRGGAPVADWPALVDAAAKLEANGSLSVAGVWSHLACADTPAHPSVDAQARTFAEALDVADRAGLRPEVRHLANSAGTLTRPDLHYDLVRPGIAVYGISPGPEVGTPAGLGLRPAMTLRARLSVAKRLPAGHGVSYGHRYTTRTETTLAVVPLGYADGIPRNATNTGMVQVGGRRYSIAGSVCMDQFVVDVGDAAVAPGDEVVLFGPGDDGEPTAEEWGDALGTIGYEIVSRIGPRVPRVHVGGQAVGARS